MRWLREAARLGILGYQTHDARHLVAALRILSGIGSQLFKK